MPNSEGEPNTFQSDGATGKELHVNTSMKEDSVVIVNMALKSREMVIRERSGLGLSSLVGSQNPIVSTLHSQLPSLLLW